MNSISPASFWIPGMFVPSGWIEHAPFAFWIVEAQQPRSLVELGTHSGYSYFAFNQVVRQLGLKTHCAAVDTWRGDEYAGFYEEGVFEAVKKYNDEHYSDQSELIRCTFDEAVGRFPDSSVDLLHIDGRHMYSDVVHDFESWRGKLSRRAVVLFHDTNVRVNNFGVHQLWRELSAQFPHFEFTHGHGLGVLGVGEEIPNPLRGLFDASRNDAQTAIIRDAYSRLGNSLSERYRLQQLSREYAEALSTAARELDSLNEQVSNACEQLQSARQSANAAEELAASGQRQCTELREELHAAICAAAAEEKEHLIGLESLENEHLIQRELMISRFGTEIERLRSELEGRELISEAAMREQQKLLAETRKLQAEKQELVARHEHACSRLREEGARLAYFEREYHEAVSSTSWRITQPFRASARFARKCVSLLQQGK
jgi:Methyltransferase domain